MSIALPLRRSTRPRNFAKVVGTTVPIHEAIPVHTNAVKAPGSSLAIDDNGEPKGKKARIPTKKVKKEPVATMSAQDSDVSGKQSAPERLEATSVKGSNARKRKRDNEADGGKAVIAASNITIVTTPKKTGKATYSSGDIDDSPPPLAVTPAARPVQTNMTNAPLQTPQGSRVLAVPLSSTPGKLVFAGDGVNTKNLLAKACAHLIQQDPQLEPLVNRHKCHVFSHEGLCEPIDPFRSLASGIMAQQVSGAAAKSIKKKFVGLFNEGEEDEANHTWPSPAQVASTELSRLRLAGLSQRKAEYIQGLAEKFASGELSAKMLAEASDEEIMEKLTAVRGLGKWSVEMFACFALKRTDIFSTGDLGVQRGMAAYMGKDVAKLKAKGGGKWKYMSEQDMLSISEKFSPYRYVHISFHKGFQKALSFQIQKKDSKSANGQPLLGAYSCGTCGELKT